MVMCQLAVNHSRHEAGPADITLGRIELQVPNIIKTKSDNCESIFPGSMYIR